MMSYRDSVSVIIPAYNSARFIGDAINSVLRQKYKNFTIFVVNDGSTDDTKRVINKFGDSIICIDQENGGPAKARNTAIQRSDSKYVAFLDSDDIWDSEKLNKQIAEFNKNEELKIVMGLCLVSQFKPYEELEKNLPSRELVFKLSFGSSLIKRSVFNEVGLLDEQLKIGEDTDWFYRAREAGMAITVQEEMVQYVRKHENNFTNTHRIDKSAVLKVFKKAIDRKKDFNSVRFFELKKPLNTEELISMWNTA